MDLPEIHEISKLRLEPGDILIVRNTEIELNSKMEDELSRRVRELMICGEGIIDGLEITADEIQAVLAAEVLAIRADQAQGILTGWRTERTRHRLVHDVLSRTTVPGYWLRAVPWREGEGAG